jgi:hypothetical protein
MSDQTQHTVALADVAAFARRSGDFTQDSRFNKSDDVTFVPWGRAKFKPYQPGADKDDTPLEHDTSHEGTARFEETPQTSVAPPPQPQPPPPPPPPLADPPPTPEDIIAAIETAREDGRGLGYKQGYDAAHREVADTLHILRKLAAELTTLADDAVERNTEIIARHVRRIAQDLFGTVIADIPEAFIDRIKTAAASFTKAGSDFTLALSPHDCLTLSAALQGEDLFSNIKIIEDDELPTGAFRLISRDLEYEDAPILSDDQERA